MKKRTAQKLLLLGQTQEEIRGALLEMGNTRCEDADCVGVATCDCFKKTPRCELILEARQNILDSEKKTNPKMPLFR